MPYLEYMARTTKPAPLDKNWLKYGKVGVNGYDRAMEITESCRYAYGSCLPNCVGYAWGRVYELSAQYNTELPTNYYSNGTLCTGNAKNWYGWHKDKSNAWARGDYPRLGAVIVYTNDKAGHVAVVEKINYKDDGSIKSIVIGEGAYLQYAFTTNTKYASKNYNYYSNLTTVGFIYPPYCSLFSPDGTASNQLEQETIVVVQDAVAKYVQKYVSNYTASDPGFDPGDPPPSPEPKDGEGNPVVVGNDIRVIGIGNSAKTGKGKEVNCLNAEYVLQGYYEGFPYPYRLGPQGGRAVGYWSKSGIQKIQQ